MTPPLRLYAPVTVALPGRDYLTGWIVGVPATRVDYDVMAPDGTVTANCRADLVKPSSGPDFFTAMGARRAEDEPRKKEKA